MKFYDDLYDRFREVHTDIITLETLPSAGLDWMPGEEMNSVNVLVVHLAGAERYWLGVALGEAPDRDREAEFKTSGLGVDQLKSIVSDTDDYARASLARFSKDDLEAVHLSPRNNKSFTVGWCLLHALEHTVLHTGHIQLTCQLWEQSRRA